MEKLRAVGPATDGNKIDLVTSIPFFGVHVAALGAFFVGFRWYYPVVALAFYYLRMFGITAGYHRYFSHRSYKTSRKSSSSTSEPAGEATLAPREK